MSMILASTAREIHRARLHDVVELIGHRRSGQSRTKPDGCEHRAQEASSIWHGFLPLLFWLRGLARAAHGT